MKNFLKQIPVATILLAILVAFVIAFLLAGIVVSWTYLFLFFYFTTFAGMDVKRVPAVAFSSALGIVSGYVSPMLTYYVDSTVGLIALLVVVILLLSLGLSTTAKPLAAIDAPCMYLFITLTTCNAYLTTVDNVIPVVITYIFGVILITAVGVIMRAVTKKAEAKAVTQTTTVEAIQE